MSYPDWFSQAAFDNIAQKSKSDLTLDSYRSKIVQTFEKQVLDTKIGRLPNCLMFDVRGWIPQHVRVICLELESRFDNVYLSVLSPNENGLVPKKIADCDFNIDKALRIYIDFTINIDKP